MLQTFNVEQGMKFSAMGEQSDPIHVAVDEESKDMVLHLIM